MLSSRLPNLCRHILAVHMHPPPDSIPPEPPPRAGKTSRACQGSSEAVSLALRLHARGLSLREIGPQVGCSHQGVAAPFDR